MDSTFSFSVEHTMSLPEKGILVTGVCQGSPAKVGDRVRFETAGGVSRELRILGVVRKVSGENGAAVEGRSGLVLEETERKDLRPPLVLAGYSGIP